jgi:predicted GTPase
MDHSTLQQELSAKFDKAKQDLKEKGPSIVILGECGAGKSTLINAVFGFDKAPVGNGAPVTQHFDYYPATDERPVHLYDSKGFELGNPEWRSRIKKFLAGKAQEAVNSDDLTKMIHAVWYVINFLTSIFYILHYGLLSNSV